MQKIDAITEIRGFNRFYTTILGLLEQDFLSSGYSLTEVRVIFEISKTERCTAKELCSLLDIDRGYMSRIMAKFAKNGLITRQTRSCDNRNREISLTAAGSKIAQELNNRSDQQIEKLIAPLESRDQAELLQAMRTIKKYLTITTGSIKIRPYKESDVAYVIERQLSLYAAERQFNTEIWQNYVTKGVLELVAKFNPDKDCMLILEYEGSPAGCIAITHTQDNIAQLRYFFLEPEVRALGAGRRLLTMALDFCREKNYHQVFLWTVSAQEAARRLYAKAGFQLTETKANDDWGVPVLEEKWQLAL